jgi:hypothetical protein
MSVTSRADPVMLLVMLLQLPLVSNPVVGVIGPNICNPVRKLMLRVNTIRPMLKNTHIL